MVQRESFQPPQDPTASLFGRIAELIIPLTEGSKKQLLGWVSLRLTEGTNVAAALRAAGEAQLSPQLDNFSRSVSAIINHNQS